ncbi:enoyl-CoA hydratase/isomerase family protein [Nocardioides speluncae]|uniref:enoyl-CoA hydratase/isomerase family protein n=1 Tax=Nocardioides speluncae TaxID=2670337 RepID=UPI000D688ADF|nr:enoyl-CoA hydratase-related protein [Nocardioides speluncae]
MTGLEYAVDGGVAHLTMNRADVANAVDLPTAREWGAAVEHAAQDPAVRVVLISGDGARFCAGGDLGSMLGEPDPPAYVKELADTLDAAFQQLVAMEKPVVAAVHGAAAGAGLSLVLSADLVVAARSTKFLAAYGAAGLTPDCGMSYLLPRAVGQQRALEVLLTGRVLTADVAREWGLVTEVVEDGEHLTRATEIATRLAAGPTFALGQAKRLSRAAWTTTRAESGADESDTISKAVSTQEAQQLMSKFAK